jgi:streptogramin lyase
VDQRLRWAVVTLLLVIVAITPTPRAYGSSVVKYSLPPLEPVPETNGHNVRSLRVKDGYIYFSYLGLVPGPPGLAKVDPTRNSITFQNLYAPAGTYAISFDFEESSVWILTADSSRSKRLWNMRNGSAIAWLVAQSEYGFGINGLSVENDHSIWLTGESLAHFNPVSGEIKTYSLPTNFTTIFKPVWEDGNLWAIAMRAYPLPMYVGDALMVFDPLSETMRFYDVPFSDLPSSESVRDLMSDNHGNLWLLLESRLARFDTATREFTVIESPYTSTGAPGVCDKDGNVYFIRYEYESRIVGFSPSDQSFTEYWNTGGAAVQDMEAGPDGNLWFIQTAFTNNLYRIEGLYRLSKGGIGLTVTSTTTLNSTTTSLTPIPPTRLTYTSGTFTTTETERMTAAVIRSESTLTAVSSTILTEARVVDEFSAFAALVLLVAISIPMLARRRRY